MTKRKAQVTFVWVTRNKDGYYKVFIDKAILQLSTIIWWTTTWDGQVSDGPLCSVLWQRYMGLHLRKGTKRRAKITKLAGGGCKWQWA